LRERRVAFDNNFPFNEDNILKLRKINDLLHKNEAGIQAHATRVRTLQMEWIQKEFIIDYEIDFQLELWSGSFDR
jgi:hypothetical protein